MAFRFDRIESEVAALKSTVEEFRSALQKVAVDAAVLESTEKRVEELETIADGLRERITELETTARILKWFAGAVSTIIIALIIAFLKSVVGL